MINSEANFFLIIQHLLGFLLWNTLNLYTTFFLQKVFFTENTKI